MQILYLQSTFETPLEFQKGVHELNCFVCYSSGCMATKTTQTWPSVSSHKSQGGKPDTLKGVLDFSYTSAQQLHQVNPVKTLSLWNLNR